MNTGNIITCLYPILLQFFPIGSARLCPADLPVASFEASTDFGAARTDTFEETDLHSSRPLHQYLQPPYASPFILQSIHFSTPLAPLLLYTILILHPHPNTYNLLLLHPT